MSSEAHAVEAHAGASVGTNITVWVGLVAITFLEVFLAYKALEPRLMLTILVMLSVAKADLLFRLVLEIRNRLTDAYQEIERMQV